MDIIEKEKKKRTILYGLLVTVLVLIGVTYAYYRITNWTTMIIFIFEKNEIIFIVLYYIVLFSVDWGLRIQ